MFSKFGMNPKHFKHVMSDKKKTILKHKDGHSITIDHNSVSKEIRSVLESMSGKDPSESKEAKSQYGKVTVKDDKPQPIGKVNVRDDIYKSKRLQTQEENDEEPTEYATGGSVKRYAEGTDEIIEAAEDPIKDQVAPFVEDINTDLEAAANETPLLQDITAKADLMAQDPDAALARSTAETEMMLAQDLGKELQAKQSLRPDQGLAERQPMASQQEGLAAKVEPSPLEAEIIKETAAIQKQADIQDELGRARAAEIDRTQQDFDKLRLADAEAQQDMLNTAKSLEQDIKNGYVDPDKYWTGYTAPNGEKVKGHSKLAAGIGMILAGFNPTNRPNAVIEGLEKQIDQSIQAQAKNLSTSENLLSANLNKFKNKHDALMATKLMMNEDLSRRIEKAAAMSSGPMAKAQAAQAIAQLKQKSISIAMQMKASLAIENLSKKPGSSGALDAALKQYKAAFPKEYAERYEGKHVPGVGIADTVEDAKELKEMKMGLSQAKSGISELLKIIDKPFKSLSFNDRAKAQTVQQTLVGALRLPITGPGAMNEGERELLQSIIANPTKVFSLDSSNKIKLKTLMDSLDQKFIAAAESKGLNIGPSAQSNEPVRGSNGRMYIKDPTGKFMIPYKGK